MDSGLRLNVNSSSQYDLTSTITSASPFNTGSSGLARNLDQAMKNATDSSTIKWTGFVDGAALLKSFDKASLISCGLSLHSPYDTNGLIVPDGDAEKFLSPLMIDKCSIQCARDLSRELYCTTTDRDAFAEII